MSIFSDFFKKQAPLLGLQGSGGGLGFLAGGGASSGIEGASGGTLVAPNPGGYEIRHFTSTGTNQFSYTSASPDATLDVFLVAGGGGGGSRGGGGGGAGGIVYYPEFPLAAYTGATQMPMYIGSGGSGFQTAPGNGERGGTAGESSSFGNQATQGPIYMRAIGGGGGRGDIHDARNDNPDTPSSPQQARGGSGGGQHECSGSQVTDSNGYQPSAPGLPAISRTYGHGYPGGLSNPSDPSGGGCPLWAGGGGGAGAAGNNGNTGGTNGGPGGDGMTTPWMPTSLGDGGYFGGGGGGGVHGPPSSGGTGGIGGGGDARGRSGPYGGYPGTNGTGGGGGGSSVDTSYSPNSVSGNGGSGIVILRYPAI